MKKDLISTSITSTILTVVLCGTAAAGMGDNPASKAARSDGLINVKALIGQPVVNQQDQRLGRLASIILNTSVDSVRYGVVRQNSALYEVPWRLMKETPTHQIMLHVKGTNLQADFIALQPAQLTASNQAEGNSFVNSKNPFFENSYNDMN